MNTPSERAGWSREALARIIDPKAWKAFDTVAEYQSRPQDEAPWSKYWHDLAWFAKVETDKALAKADAIMALAPPSSLDGGELQLAMERLVGLADQKARASTAVRADADLYDDEPEHQSYLRSDAARLEQEVKDLRLILAALAAAPLSVGKQGVSSDSGSPTPHSGSHNTDQRSTS